MIDTINICFNVTGIMFFVLASANILAVNASRNNNRMKSRVKND
jgi:hypothetical protein